MNNKFKLTSAILSASLLVTPISAIVHQNNNVAKAEEIKKENKNIQKHIEYIDKQIYIENNNLKINKNSILNYIKQHWNEININKKFNNPEEYYKNIELSINQMNKKINSGWYKLNIDKSIQSKYQERGNRGGYETYNYWWGAQFYAKSSWGAENLARDCEENAYASGASTIIIGAFVAPVGVMTGLAALNFGYMATKVRQCFSDYGSVKLTIYGHGAYFETEPIK